MVHVGKDNDKETFQALKTVICSQSPFFAAAFNGDFLEGHSQEITLDDVEKDVFAMMLKWMYREKITGLSQGMILPVCLYTLANLLLQNHSIAFKKQSSNWQSYGSLPIDF